jgi:hypothetical protein
MIPGLRGIIEDAHPIGPSGGGDHDLIETQIGKFGTYDKFAQSFHVCAVMLIVMKV